MAKSKKKENKKSPGNLSTKALLSKKIQPKKAKKPVETPVDKFVPDSVKYSVLSDPNKEHNGKSWSETLNNTQLSLNMNKFYIMQLLEHKKSKTPFNFTRWGRVGYDGNIFLKSAQTLNQAKQFFIRKYEEKLDKGYVPLVIDNSPSLDQTEEPLNSSGLDQRVENLVKLIFDTKAISLQMKQIGYDTTKTVLGKLGKQTLKKAYLVLKEIELVLQAKSEESLSDLSSQFYTLIPHNFGFSKVRKFLIKDEDVLSDKINLLKALSDVELTAEILQKHKGKTNYILNNYNKLNTEINPVEPESEEFSILEQLANTSENRSFTVLEAFSLNQKKHKFKDYPNKKLLWYSAGLTNYVRILSKGLETVPSTVPSAIFPFGKGIYLHDVCSKAVSQCQTRNGEVLLLLCETGLGASETLNRPFLVTKSKPNGFNSTIGIGMNIPDPKGHITVKGVEIPLGKVIKNPTKTFLGYNNYVVYDPAQIQLKYLIKLKL